MKSCFDWKQQSDKEIQFQTGCSPTESQTYARAEKTQKVIKGAVQPILTSASRTDYWEIPVKSVRKFQQMRSNFSNTQNYSTPVISWKMKNDEEEHEAN